MGKKNLNYFSESESNSMYKFQEFRNKIFLPISKLLMKVGLTANIISYIGLFVLIGFILNINSNPVSAVVFLALHVFIDAFDGPLARLMNQEGNSGAFTDMICDHTGMAVVVVTLIWANLVDPILASIYLYIYTMLIIFVVIRNQMKVPIKFVIRTKYYLYALFALFAIWNLNFLDQGLLLFTVLMLPSLFSSYFVIKKSL